MFERWFKNLFTESKASQPTGPVDIIPITKEITPAEIQKARILPDGRIAIPSSSEIDFFDLPLAHGKNKGVRIKPREFTYYLPLLHIASIPLQGTLLVQGGSENLILLHRNANHSDPKEGYTVMCSVARTNKKLQYQLGNTLIVYDPATLLRLFQTSGELSIVPCELQHYCFPYSVHADIPNAKMIVMKNGGIAVLTEKSLQHWALHDARYQLEKSIPLEIELDPSKTLFIETPQENIAIATALWSFTYKKDGTLSKSLENMPPLLDFKHIPNSSFLIARDRKEDRVFLLNADKMELYPQEIKATDLLQPYSVISKECIIIADTCYKLDESAAIAAALDAHLPRDPASIVVAYVGPSLIEIPQPSLFKEMASIKKLSRS